MQKYLVTNAEIPNTLISDFGKTLPVTAVG